MNDHPERKINEVWLNNTTESLDSLKSWMPSARFADFAYDIHGDKLTPGECERIHALFVSRSDAIIYNIDYQRQMDKIGR